MVAMAALASHINTNIWLITYNKILKLKIKTKF